MESPQGRFCLQGKIIISWILKNDFYDFNQIGVHLCVDYVSILRMLFTLMTTVNDLPMITRFRLTI